MSVSFVYPQYLWLLLLVPLTVTLALLGRRALSRVRFWGGLALRSFLLSLIVLALAGIQLRLRADTLSVVFLLDVSDSVPEAEQSRGEALIRQAIHEMPGGDRAAVVLFGEDPLVERLASEDRSLPDFASVPVTARTDIGSALQLALALFPDEGAKRLVLLSDGRENLNRALDQAELAAAHGIELLYVPLGLPEDEVEVLVESLKAPGNIRQGQSFDLEVILHSTAQVRGTLRAFGDGALLHTQEVQLQPGTSRFLIPVDAKESGFRRFRAQIIPDADNRLQNNAASAFTVVHGPARILVVEGQPGDAENLAQALAAAEMDIHRVTPPEVPGTLPELAGYEAVILANVHAAALPPGVMQALPVYLRELGKGLLMTGGEEAFGAGGYLRTPLEAALPVDMDVKSKALSPNLALVLAVDKSGSMGRCHCDDPDLSQTYERREVGQPKVDIAKEAIMRAASALGDQDYLGVVTFDNQAHWVVRVARLIDPYGLEQSIGSFQADGQTNLRAGVEAAYDALLATAARRKHIILMTDGWVHAGELTQLAEEMQEQGITLSVVAAGEGSAEYLAALSRVGGGRFYPAVDVLSVPDIFLKETVQSVGQYIIEEPFYPLPAVPSPLLRGIDPATLPPLLGYNGTSSKNTARLDLLTPRGDPLLASWQYGLGRAAVWTSDLKGQWAKEWLEWDDFARFAAQVVGWILPAPQVEGLAAQASLEDGQAVIRLEALDENGRPRNFLRAVGTIIAPDLEAQEVSLEQVGAGQYQVLLDASHPGTYLVRLGVNENDQSLGMLTLGLVVPYSPEYKASGIDLGLLAELARLTGGSELLNPPAAFIHNLPAVDYAREIWRALLLVAALLFPFDVALRRVMLGWQDVQKAQRWISRRLPGRGKVAGEVEPLLDQLFQARARARQHLAGSEMGPQPVPPQAENDEPSGAPSSPPPETASEDAFNRLRQAKKRARRGG